MTDIYALKIRHAGDEDMIALYVTREEAEAAVSVSYTHLTLPTKRIV